MISGPGLVRAAQQVALILLLACCGLLIGARAFRDMQGAANLYRDRLADRDSINTSSEDYTVFYAAGEMVREGRGSQVYNSDAVVAEEIRVMGRPVGGTGRLAYFSPPFVAGIWAPLSAVSVDAALTIWISLIGAVMLTCALAGPWFVGLRGWYWAAATAGLLVSTAGMAILKQGQLSAFVLASWILFAGLLQRDRKFGAGAALALAIVKPQYAVLGLAYLAWRHEWRALAGFFAVATPLVVASLAIAGIGAAWGYPLYLLGSLEWNGINGVSPEMMIGWHGLFHRLNHAPWLFIIAANGLTLVVATVSIRRRGGHELALAAILLASLLVSSHLYTHDMVLAMVAAWLVVVARPASWLLLVIVPTALATNYDVQTILLALFLVCLAIPRMRAPFSVARYATAA